MCARNISLCVPVPDSALYRSIIAPTGVWQQTDLNLFLCSSNNPSKVFKARKLCVCVFVAKVPRPFGTYSSRCSYLLRSQLKFLVDLLMRSLFSPRSHNTLAIILWANTLPVFTLKEDCGYYQRLISVSKIP